VEQKGVTIWMTGMSGAGKTALAIPLQEELPAPSSRPIGLFGPK